MTGRTTHFLWEASKIIPRPRTETPDLGLGLGLLAPSGLVFRLLRTKWKAAVQKETPAALPKILGKSPMCSFCCGSLEGLSHIKIIPKKKLGKKMKRIVNKYNSSGAVNFTTYEKVLWRKYQANIGNTLILTCMSCRNKTTIPMEKPTPLQNLKEELAYKQPAKKKKKKKAKDHLAGLKLSVVTKTNVSIVGSKLNVDTHTKCNKDNQPKKNIKLAQDIHTANLKTKPKTCSHQSWPSSQKKHAWQPVAKTSGGDTVAFKKFKKCNKLSEILAKSSNAKPASQKLKSLSILNSLHVMLRKN